MNKEWYEKNKEKIIKKNKEWRENNYEKIIILKIIIGFYV